MRGGLWEQLRAGGARHGTAAAAAGGRTAAAAAQPVPPAAVCPLDVDTHAIRMGRDAKDGDSPESGLSNALSKAGACFPCMWGCQRG